jgi:hypothetical protein
MAVGPFVTYAPPGVYTRTLTDANASNLVTGLRIPVVIGVGQEELEQSGLEMVRGSSASIDQEIVSEDATLSWVVDATNPQNVKLGAQTGALVTLKVKNLPIVKGDGTGAVSNDIKTVTVTVNGVPVALGSVQGAKGLVTLQVPPQPTDVVRVTYFFHRGDTSFADDVSSQVSVGQATLTSPGYAPFVITAGQNDTLALSVNGVDSTVVLTAASYTAAALKTLIDAAAIANLVVAVSTDEAGKDHLAFSTTQNLVVRAGSANGPLGFTAGAASARNATFQVFNRPIVDGSGGGVTTTDTSKVTVKVGTTQVIPTSVDGKNGTVTLGFAPAAGAVVKITYSANTWQDTFDYLPNSLVTTVLSCGISTDRADYIQGQDFVVSNPSADVSILHWGTSYVVAAGSTTIGATPFATTQVTGTLVDDKMYLAACTPVTDTSTIPATVSATHFVLPEVPTLGNGRDTALGLSLYQNVSNQRQDVLTNRPDLVTVRVGRSLADALNRTAAVVTAVDGESRTITLRDPLPPDYKVYATFWYNRITDDTYVLTNSVAGALGTGQYTMKSSLTGADIYQAKFGTKSGLSQTVQWPRGVETVPDAFHTGAGTPVSETVRVTFGTHVAGNAAFTNRLAEPYSFFTPYSGTWTTKVNGTNRATNLNTATVAYLVGSHVAADGAGHITIPASPANVLNLVIDGTPVAVTLTPGSRTPVQIVGEINTAIDAAAPFVGTAPNLMCSSVQLGGITADIVFWIKGLEVPTALPGGFDTGSTVQIAQGTVEAVLGFKTLQVAHGTPAALNKPATILGSLAGPFNITAGVNDTLAFKMNGIAYTVTLPAGAAVATSAIVSAINTATGATTSSAGTLVNLDHLRLLSTTNDATSRLEVLVSNAAATLGLTAGATATQTKVLVNELVSALMATTSFTTGAIAYGTTLNGRQYLTVESILTGAASSSIAFVGGTNSAFNAGSGIGITPGTDGDVGEDAYNNFVVTSSSPSGSAGTGIPGQTYTDAVTGLRFTVLPATTGAYTATGYFTLLVTPTFDVSPSIPTYAIPGLETLVSNTVGIGVGDTGSVQTFNPGGLAPAVGDFYFVSYRFLKQDFSTRIFQQTKAIEANFGKISPENRCSLAAYLAIINGAVLVGVKQVLKLAHTAQASDASFITAIQELATPLQGNVKPDVLVPLSSSTGVYSYLTSHCETQSNQRNQAERMGMIGFASGTSPSNAQTIAKSLNSNRIVCFYPDSAVITLQDQVGQSFESLVDGTFFAAAIAGSSCSPAIDVATPFTHRRVQGFTRIPRSLDPVVANQTAMAGITVLEDLQPLVRIRQGLTTNMTSVMTRLPTITQISDYVQQSSRGALDSFVGTKFLVSRTNEVVVTMTSLLKGLVAAEIIANFNGVAASVSADDPTVLLFDAYYQPIFPLLYLVLTFNLRAKL